MKSIKFLSFVLALVMGLSSCSSSWLDTETTGPTLTQEQYDNLPNTAEGAVLGLYSMIYANGGGGSNHHYFGYHCLFHHLQNQIHNNKNLFHSFVY